jgi:hypothetical protein
MFPCFNFQTYNRPTQLVIGTITNPTNTHIRTWRRLHMKNTRHVIQVFITGFVSNELCEHMSREKQDDMISVMTTEGPRRGLIEKTLAWFAISTSLFPRTKFIAKTEDDVYIHMQNIHIIIKSFPRVPHIAAGWMQSGYINTRSLQMCGHMKLSNRTCMKNYRKEDSLVGPYYYPAGILEIFSKQIIHVFRSTKFTNFYLSHKWGSQVEDSVVGYVIQQQLNIYYVELFPSISNLWHLDRKLIRPKQIIALHKVFPDKEFLRKKAQREMRQNNLFKKKHIPSQNHMELQQIMNIKWLPIIENIDDTDILKNNKVHCKELVTKGPYFCRFKILV